MLLIITNQADYTADFLILELKKREIDFIRLNTEDFPQSADLVLNLSNRGIDGSLSVAEKRVDLAEIQSAWYRRPAASVPSPEIRDPLAKGFVVDESRETLEGLWRILPCFWVSRPDNIRLAESKIRQLQVASSLNFVIPETLITNSPSIAHAFYGKRKPLICKVQRRGRFVRQGSASFIYTSRVEERHVADIANVRLAPTLLQSLIPKKVDIRATVVGDQVFAVAIYSQDVDEARQDWRRADARSLRHEPHELPKDLERKCVSLVEILGLQFGAIDLILTPEGEYFFLEINPNGQWAWIEEVCPEMSIRDAMIELLSGNGERSEKQ